MVLSAFQPEGERGGKSPCPNLMLVILQKARICAGVLLLITSIVAAVMFGQSWNERLDIIAINASSTNLLDDEDYFASLALLLIPILIAFVSAGLWYVCHRRRMILSHLGKDNTVGERNLFNQFRRQNPRLHLMLFRKMRSN